MSLKGIRASVKTTSFRLVLGYSAIFVVCFMGILAGIYFYLEHHLTKMDRKNLKQVTTELIGLYQNGGVEALQGKASSFHPYIIRLASPGHQTIVIHETDDMEDKLDPQVLDAHVQKPQEIWFQNAKSGVDDDTASDVGFDFYSKMLSDGRFLQVGHSTEGRQELLEGYRNLFQLAVIPLILLGMLAGSFLAYHNILNPVRTLTQTLETILEGDLSARVPEGQTQDEFGRLSHLFNQMLDRIETLIKEIKQSTDNVAHDLRTPLTRLRVVAEAALQKDSTIKEYKEALADCVEEADRIHSLLNTIMDISEAESGVMKLNLEAVPIYGVLRETVELYQHIADEKEIAFHWHAVETEAVLADRNRLRQVLANLVDNALKYTPKGGWVEFRARSSDGVSVITIQDSGIGISPVDLPHVWDRLYRGDQSRSQKGMGLGLSLVKAVVDAHHGKVSVESAPEQGALFTIELPSPNPTNL